MREKDWRKRREELRQYMGGSMSAKPKSTPKSKELFLFRLYVTVILAGGVLLVSLFHSETAEKLTQQVKETIAYEMPLEKIQAAGERLTVLHTSGQHLHSCGLFPCMQPVAYRY